MPIIPLFGLGTKGKSPTVTAERHLNLYAEFVPDADKTRVAFYGTPGWDIFTEANGDTPIRGWIAINDLIYYVHRGTLYSINNAATRTSLGMLNTSSGKVDMAYDGAVILIVDGTNGYNYNKTYSTFFTIAQISTGTTTSTSAGKLVDSGGAFDTDGTTAGMVAYNTTDGTQTIISAVDSATTLSVVDDIFSGSENYTIGETNFPDGANTCTWLAGQFVVDAGSTSDSFYISADGASWNPLDFASAESAPDGLVRVFADHGQILLFGTATLEPWGNVGATDFPFAAIQGSIQEIGLASRWALQKFDSAIAFLGKNRQGQVQLYRMDGYQLTPFSSPEVDANINGYATVSDAVMMSFVDRGHPFLIISFPSAEKSWMYDGSTHLWSPRESGLSGGRFAGDLAIDFLNKIRISDYSSGNIYTLSPTTYTENGTAIAREIVSKHYFRNYDRVIVNELRVDFETGVGLSGNPVSYGTNYLNLPGASGDYASTPDSAVLDITGDIDFIVYAAADDWTPSASNTFCAKYYSSSGNFSYEFYIVATGILRISTSSTGAAGGIVTSSATTAVSAVNGEGLWLRATLDVNDGSGNRVAKFYTSTDSVSTEAASVSWTQLGSTVTTVGTTSIYASTAPLEIGSRELGTSDLFAGKIYIANVYSGIGGTLVASFNATNATTGVTTLVSNATGETYTLHGSASITGDFVHATQGANPQAMLSYSKDNGHTWSAESWASIGAVGKYLSRVEWRRLGIARDWLFKIRVTDPIPVVITGAAVRAQDVGS